MLPSQRPRGEDAPRGEGGLRARVSLHGGRAPLGGRVEVLFAWDDLLDAPFPRAEQQGPHAYCLPAPETATGASRVENVVLVTVDEDGCVEVDDRLFVSPRMLGAAIERERAVVGTALQQEHRRVQRKARWRLKRARRLQARGETVRSVPHVAAHAAGHAWAAVITGARRASAALTTFPDAVAVRLDRSRRFLATPEGRAKLRKGLVDPHGLTAEEKAITLFVGTGSLLAALLVIHLAVTLSVPALATDWRAVFFLFLYAYVTSLGVAFPIEPILFPAAMVIGKPAALLVTVAAKVCAAWMVFFVGDSVHHQVRKKAESSERWARFLDWSERFASRFGVGALALFIATPGLPDFIALYVFGALHMRMRQFLLGVALGSTILNGLILYGVGRLLGI